MNKKFAQFALIQVAALVASVAPSLASSHGSMGFHGGSHQPMNTQHINYSQNSNHDYHDFHNPHFAYNNFHHHHPIFVNGNDWYAYDHQMQTQIHVQQPVAHQPAPSQDHIPELQIQTYNWN